MSEVSSLKINFRSKINATINRLRTMVFGWDGEFLPKGLEPRRLME